MGEENVTTCWLAEDKAAKGKMGGWIGVEKQEKVRSVRKTLLQ